MTSEKDEEFEAMLGSIGVETVDCTGAAEEVGRVTWHCSEEDGLPDVGQSIALPDGEQLWFGEISRSRWEEAGEDAAAIGPDFGWWIIHYTKTESTVIGKCLNADAADALVNVLSAALRATSAPPKKAPS